MKFKFKSPIFLFAASAFVLSLASCTGNSDKETTSTVTTADSGTVMTVDSGALSTTAVDTTTMSTTTTMAPSMSVVDSSAATIVKPNAAKKGLKGKVTVTAPSKGTGSMEMDKQGVYTNVEYLPAFPGGNNGLQKFFNNNLQYPEAATDDGVEGTVMVNFVVDETGKISSPQVQGQTPGYGLDAEALRVVKKMPAWTPGKLKGKNVKTRFSLPIVFQLN